MAMDPGVLGDQDSRHFRQRLAQLTDWQLRVLASLLWLEKNDHDTSDLAGLPALLDSLTPTGIEDAAISEDEGDDDSATDMAPQEEPAPTLCERRGPPVDSGELYEALIHVSIGDLPAEDILDAYIRATCVAAGVGYDQAFLNKLTKMLNEKRAQI